MTEAAVGEKPDLIVWPASSLPAAISTSRLVRYTIVQLARETNTYLLVGGAGYEKLEQPKDGDPSYSNSEFLIAPSGHLNGQYNKIRLLPFNEYVPLKGKIAWPRMIATIRKSFMPGRKLHDFQGKRRQIREPHLLGKFVSRPFSPLCQRRCQFYGQRHKRGVLRPYCSAAPNPGHEYFQGG